MAHGWTLAAALLAAAPCAAAAGAAPAPPAPEAVALVNGLLAGCEPAPHPGGVRFTCDQLLATVAEFPRGAGDVQALNDAAVGGIGAGGGLQVSSSKEDLVRDGKVWPVLRVLARPRAGEAPVFEARVLTLLLRGHAVRQVVCGAAPDRRDRAAVCDQLIPALARTGPAPFAPAPQAPMVGARRVEVPPGCEVVSANASAFQLRCGETANVSYMRLADEEQLPRVLAMLGDQLRHALPVLKPGPARACRIAGVATSCRTLSGGGASFYLGAAMADGVPTLVQCAQEARISGPHPVCATVLSF